MKEIRHICLDKDGTLIDVHLYWSSIIHKRSLKILEQYSISREYLGDLCLAMGIDLPRQKIIKDGPVGYKPRQIVIEAAVRTLKGLNKAATFRLVSELFEAVDREMQQREDYQIKVLPNIGPALKVMKELDLKISIYTSDRLENLKSIMRKLKLETFFDGLIGGDLVKNPKPDPEGFLLACEAVGVSLEHSIYVGDTVDDMQMAKLSSDGQGWGVTTGLCSQKELLKHTPYVFPSLLAMSDHLMKGRNRCITH